RFLLGVRGVVGAPALRSLPPARVMAARDEHARGEGWALIVAVERPARVDDVHLLTARTPKAERAAFDRPQYVYRGHFASAARQSPSAVSYLVSSREMSGRRSTVRAPPPDPASTPPPLAAVQPVARVGLDTAPARGAGAAVRTRIG